MALIPIWTEACAEDQGAAIQRVVVPRGVRQIRDITFSPWRKTCFEVPEVGSICRTSAVGTMGTGQQVIRADIIESAKDATRLQLILPPVFFLPAGVKVGIGPESVQIPYLWCVSNACVAAGRLDQRFVEQMPTLRQISIGFVDTSLLAITTQIPLASFQEAHDAPPARSFDGALEETR